MDPKQIDVIRDPVTRDYVAAKAGELFCDMVKAVVDTRRRIMAVGGELHSDEELVLLEDGSNQADLWGINLHIDLAHPDWIEFDSMINLRPSHGNRTRGVDDPLIRERIMEVVGGLVQP